MNITVPSGAKGSSRWLEPRSLDREWEKGTGGLQTAASQITRALCIVLEVQALKGR